MIIQFLFYLSTRKITNQCTHFNRMKLQFTLNVLKITFHMSKQLKMSFSRKQIFKFDFQKTLSENVASSNLISFANANWIGLYYLRLIAHIWLAYQYFAGKAMHVAPHKILKFRGTLSQNHPRLSRLFALYALIHKAYFAMQTNNMCFTYVRACFWHLSRCYSL